MKNVVMLAVTAIVAATLGNALAAMPGAVTTEQVASADTVQPVLSMADQELPFDRYWSKN
ncbi:hypothetical protein IC762_00415 [Bradyrhizobium genosp. L]|uniref:hypothetical protein n=1 Tax=Bradyrhizobium genosp. L TaxID=83637 RepID=UPI0018A2EE94|nr:hypothetical protein [Bradyrhizobium genosp. L]QPF84840.1 hypothetical protein IC762_00415 [Bradyrhizobium genosp. L]